MEPAMKHAPRSPRSRTLALALVALSASLPAGCRSPQQAPPQSVELGEAAQASADRAFAAEPFSDQVRAGVLRQRALYEHHFEGGSAQLNALGRRDIVILAQGLAESGGRIAVDRGSAPKQLYAARLDAVRAMLQLAGVPGDRVKVGDGPAGGSGVNTAETIEIRKDMRAEPKQSWERQVIDNRRPMTRNGGAQ
jgi:hypothetical protein